MSKIDARPPGPRLRQRGAAAMGLVLALALAVAAAIVSYASHSSHALSAATPEQTRIGEWAMSELDAYAAVFGQLPCPARLRAGPQDCSLSEGWLPDLFVSGDANQARGDAYNVILKVYRSPDTQPEDPDLGSAYNVNSYVPPLTNDSGSNAAQDTAQYTQVVSGNDFCGKLRALGTRGASGTVGGPTPWELASDPHVNPRLSDRLHIPDPEGSGQVFNVAYGIAVLPSGQAGNNHGVNLPESGPSLESPSRMPDGRYRDLVLVRTFRDLYGPLHCDANLAATDQLAIAQAHARDFAAVRQGDIDSLQWAVNAQSLAVSFATTFVAADVADTDVAVEKLVENLAKLCHLNAPPELYCIDATAHIVGAVTASGKLASSSFNALADLGVLATYSAELQEAMSKRDLAAGLEVWNEVDLLNASDSAGPVDELGPSFTQPRLTPGGTK